MEMDHNLQNQTQIPNLTPGKSYRDVLKSNEEETFDLTPVVIEHKVRLKIPLALVERTEKLWENCLVGRFSGPRPGLETIRSWTRSK